MEVEKQFRDLNIQQIAYSNSEELPSTLQKHLDIIARKEGYLSYKIFNRTNAAKGENYLATLYEIYIIGTTNKGEKETNIFIKFVHNISNEHVKVYNVTELYSKELFFYKELSKVYMELQLEARLPLHEMYKAVKSYNESNTEAIILKNLAKEGFTTVYRMNIMPLKFAEISVQQLGKFHSLSFVLQQKRPQYFERKIKTLKQSMIFDDNFEKIFRNMFNYSVKEIDLQSRIKLSTMLPKLLEEFQQYLNGSKTTVKCLCHGDYRMNNILMKVTDGVITEVIPVDYQHLYFGSPIIDFIFFIFGATDQDFRRKHLDHLKEVYFETMKNYLKYFKINIDSVYPRKEFEKDYDECVFYGLLNFLFIMPIILTNEYDAPDLNVNDILNVTFNLDHRFYGRLKEIINDMIELGKL